MLMADFWKSAGMHLVRRNPQGWLDVTPELLLAYFTRPEVHPIETSCEEEVRLHEELLRDPYLEVGEDRLSRLADPDAADNYRAVLALRQLLTSAGTIEGAYLKLIRTKNVAIPPVFMDQMVHLILRNILDGTREPMRLRAAEIFFREQIVSLENGRLLLADEEIVDMHARTGRETGLAQLLAESGTAMRSVELDVLDDDNSEIYWERSDRFDTVVDFRFEQPALDAFARVIEAWLLHLVKLEVRVEPRPKLEDPDWRWHIGLDRESNRILNALFEGRQVALSEIEQLVALFRMWIKDERLVIDRVKRRPVYLALAMTPVRRIKMKPQNLLSNLPLLSAA
jgi:hypothetical protein